MLGVFECEPDEVGAAMALRESDWVGYTHRSLIEGCTGRLMHISHSLLPESKD